MSMTEELGLNNEQRTHVSKNRYRQAKARLLQRGERVTEFSLADEAGVCTSAAAQFMRYHPRFAAELGLVQIFKSGQRIKSRGMARYRAAAETIRARGERVTYTTMSEQLKLKPSAVQSYFSSKRKFAQVLGLAPS
jgi:hypothetical protein